MADEEKMELLRIFCYFFCLIVATIAISSRGTLIGVIFCADKDLEVIEDAVQSSVKHLLDITAVYIVSTDSIYEELKQREFVKGPKIAALLSEKSLSSPTKLELIDAMIKVTRREGNRNMKVEEEISKRGGWIWQQYAKLWARQLIGFDGDYVVIDSDVVWFRDVRLVDQCKGAHNVTKGVSQMGVHCRYFYATSNQYHEAYLQSVTEVLGLDFARSSSGEGSSGGITWTKGRHISGITHHMVLSGFVLDSLYAQARSLSHHAGLSFFEIFVKEAAKRMLCALKHRCSGGTSSISEYELYFQYTRTLFPRTMSLRPLMWANGPAPGRVFRPIVFVKSQKTKTLSDLYSFSNWVIEGDNSSTFQTQKFVDASSGFDFVAYHRSARNRRYELRFLDVQRLCEEDVELSTPCLVEERRQSDWKRTSSESFRHCACFYAKNFP